MEKIVEIGILYGYYGSLLTEKQKEAINWYYNENLSLTEIADENNNSKQAISLLLKRSVNKLYEFEDCLHLKQKNELLKSKLDILKKMIENENSKEEIFSYIDSMKDKV